MKAADPQFSALADADGRPLDDAFRAARRDHLIELFSNERPAAIITEMFPFGRRQLRFELVPLLEAVIYSFDATRKLPLYMRAGAVRQTSAHSFDAQDVLLTTSEFAEPHFAIGAAWTFPPAPSALTS